MVDQHATIDHEEIKRWADERQARPAAVRNTGDPGVIRLDFPWGGAQESLEHIGWDDWFEKFDANNLAFLYQDEAAGGERSNFNKLVSRERVADQLA